MKIHEYKDTTANQRLIKRWFSDNTTDEGALLTLLRDITDSTSVSDPATTAVLFYVDSSEANTLAINVNNEGVLTSATYSIPSSAVKASFFIWIEDNQTSLVGEVVDVSLAITSGLVNAVEEGTKNVLGGLF